MFRMNTSLYGKGSFQAFGYLQTYSFKQAINKPRKKGISAMNKKIQYLFDQFFWTNKYQQNDQSWKKKSDKKPDFLEQNKRQHHRRSNMSQW